MNQGSSNELQARYDDFNSRKGRFYKYFEKNTIFILHITVCVCDMYVCKENTQRITKVCMAKPVMDYNNEYQKH